MPLFVARNTIKSLPKFINIGKTLEKPTHKKGHWKQILGSRVVYA